ncbi:hypothetical protein WOLCODRAFT_139810 [Wolfiporia cocos MD-104 SS10]|uniref:Uncharacterized protein n=1 Tax=Wolfiporia cocos (strain MD-104) TaxID=742152 RepID=A0A2H3JEU2_WOLCO|nr:hypothetical protein WOLCODRAFT_139810 [Wolfiporia cocos MD-104 SS10]
MAYLQPPPVDTRRNSVESDITLGGSSSCTPYGGHAFGDNHNAVRRRSSSLSLKSHIEIKVEVVDDNEKVGLAEPASDKTSVAAPDRPVAIPAGEDLRDDTRTEISNLQIELTDDNVYPIAPQKLLERRYDCRPQLSRRIDDSLVVKAWSTCFQHDEKLLCKWDAFEHPEGQRYFRKQLSSGIQLFTDLWLYAPEKATTVEAVANYLFATFDKLNHPEEEIDIVISIDDDGPNPIYYYYCADHASKTVFWPENVYATIISLGVRPVSHPRYLKDASTVQYWTHIEMYPNDRYVSSNLVEEVRQLVHFAAFDSQTSKTSTSPYGPDDLAIVSNILREIRVGVADASSMFIIARVSNIFYWERFLNFHGQQEARLDREQAVFEETRRKRSYLITVISPLLFYLPDQYIGEIHKIWVDHTINHRPWRAFIAGLQRDWESSILPATVLLSANVGLLQIGSIDTGQSARSVAQVACYISTFFCLGNIVLCTILSRYHRPRAQDTADEAAEYLHQRSRIAAGLELLAIAFSFPAALFCWGMFAFFVAVAWVCMDGTSALTRVLTALSLGIVTILTAAVIFLELWPTYTFSRSSWLPDDRLRIFSPLWSHCFRRRRDQQSHTESQSMGS